MNGRITLGIVCLLLGAASLVAGLVLGMRLQPAQPVSNAEGAPPAAPPVTAPAPAATAAPSPAVTPTPTAAPTPDRSVAALQAQVSQVTREVGVSVGVSLIELAGNAPVSWSMNGDESFVAASTYKLPLLMEEAQHIATGQVSTTDQLCYESDDWEDGYFSDYADGQCFSRGELDRRVGIYSDNTAAHILVRYDGGTDALNAYARAHGASESAFYDPNETTASDLARLWQNEAAGQAGGVAAQRYLYPLLTHTMYEQGIPAGVPSGTTVVHKIGDLDSELNDAGLILNGPRGSYVLSICTDNGSWQLIAEIARDVDQFERS